MVTSYVFVAANKTAYDLHQTMDKNKGWVQREVRYQVADHHSLSATVYRTSESGAETIQADLLDISRRGL